MIDTIAITLTKIQFQITDPEKFTHSADWALEDRIKSIRIVSKQNPTKKELLKGIYKPKLTLAYRSNPAGALGIILRIELSLPKLAFGNNFNELRFKDFNPVVQKLVLILREMGIVTTAQAIAQAPISAIHYSKNIKLTDGTTPYYYLQKLKESNMRLSLDVNQTDYRNEGHSYKWHTNSYEIVFYDKIKDLEKAKVSSKRAIEKESALQLQLLNGFKKRWKLEILRMEVRLNKRTKIKHLFKKLGIKSDLTLQKLFKPAISKKVLLYYLEELESKRPLLLDYKAADSKALLTELILNNTHLKAKQILLLFGLKQALDITNPRELRIMFARCNAKSWQRMMSDAAKLNLSFAPSPLRILKEQLMKFEMIKVI